MSFHRFSALLPASVFVLLWSSGAIVSQVGLQHGSAFAVLLMRYLIASATLCLFAAWSGNILPRRGTRLRNGSVGVMMAGLYSACYLFALENGMTPGALASILGVQPILTLLITERRVTLGRATGLILSMLGLVMIVSEGIIQARFDILGIIFASASLIGITIGSILQKGEDQPPWKVLPLQYVSGLIIILALSPIGHYQASWNVEFLVPVLWLGLVVSVGATFVLYQLIASGNLVNVTSLFYLVPGETALLDWALLGNAMTIQMLTGLVLVIGGLMVAFRQEAN